MVVDCLLELSVLTLAGLRGSLHLRLCLLHRCTQLLNLLRVCCDLLFQIADQRNQRVLLVIAFCSVTLILSQIIDAAIAEIHFILLLLLQLNDHLVNFLFDFGEGVQLHRGSNERQLGVSAGSALEDRHCSLAPVLLLPACNCRALNKGCSDDHLIKGFKALWAVEDFDCVLDCHNLFHSALHAGVVLRSIRRALLLQSCEELLVHLELHHCIFKCLDIVRLVLSQLRQLCVDGYDDFLPGLDLGLLRDHHRIELLHGFRFGLLLLAECRLEVLLHLFQDSKNLATLWSITLVAWD
mmetsp:Transcript_22935/g.39180  ORF Transcript_22935/g.39180 Transcript_22935/m.39180 type:complete len:296 (-) Transcript_22935:687-1574(-)